MRSAFGSTLDANGIENCTPALGCWTFGDEPNFDYRSCLLEPSDFDLSVSLEADPAVVGGLGFDLSLVVTNAGPSRSPATGFGLDQSSTLCTPLEGGCIGITTEIWVCPLPELAPGAFHEQTFFCFSDAPVSVEFGGLVIVRDRDLRNNLVEDTIDVSGDVDGDGVANELDNCLAAANGPSAGPNDQVDSDADQIGNVCDGDFNQDDFVGGPDFDIFLQCFNRATGAGVGPLEDPNCEESDMNADGFVGGPDFDRFLERFNGPPGPSGL